MDETQHNFTQAFENKSESELEGMKLPEGLGAGAALQWRRARQRAIVVLRKDAAKKAVASAPVAQDDAASAVEECALREEEAAQPLSIVGKMSIFSDPAPQIDDDALVAPPFARPLARRIRNDGDTEHLLNGLIAECHLMIRAIMLPSAMRAGDVDTRRQFLNSAMEMAQTGAKIGRAIAKLRGAGAVNEIRQRHISEHVITTPAPQSQNTLRT